MSFREEMKAYFDFDGLVGTAPHPPIWSGGNQILDTATWLLYLRLIDAYPYHDDDLKAGYAIQRCQTRIGSGMVNKNPGRTDQITHDCIIGAIVISSITGSYWCLRFIQFAERFTWLPIWVASNTGKIYWTAIVKPWHKAFYKLACPTASRSPGLIGYACLASAIFHDAMFNKTNASNKKLMWVMVRTLERKMLIPSGGLCLLERAMRFWDERLKALGGIKPFMATYYGVDHPFAKYAPQ